MRARSIAVFAISMLLLGTSGTAHSEQKGVHPVAARLYGEFVIAGGLANGKWVPAQRMLGLLPSAVTYRLYSVTEYIGSGVGRRFKESELQDYIPLPVIRIQPTAKAEWNMQYASIAVAGTWETMPGKVKKGFDFGAYRTQVKEYLADKGIVADSPVIDQVLRADLDGDGKAEIIASGSQYQSKEFEPPNPVVGDYAYVVLFPGSRNAFPPRTVEGVFFTSEDSLKKNEWTVFKPIGICDVDADKRMELVTVTEVFEATAAKITKLVNGDLKELQIYGR